MLTLSQVDLLEHRINEVLFKIKQRENEIELHNLTNPKNKIIEEKKPTQICIPWRAGAGKTTTIAQFIVRHWEEGIVYSTSTISELQRMKQMVLDIDPSLDKRIIEFHSENPDWEELKANSDKLRRHRILLITDSSLATCPPSLLINQANFYQELKPLDGIRKWILTDEKPTLFKKLVISPEMIMNLYPTMKRIDPKSETNILDLFPRTSIGRNSLKSIGKDVFNSENLPVKRVESNHTITKVDKFGNEHTEIATERYEIDKDHYRARQLRLAVELLHDPVLSLGDKLLNFDENSEYNSSGCQVFYDISKVSGVTVHVNFDGTGDILFGKSSSWIVAENDYPYQWFGLGKFKPIEEFKPLSRSYNKSYDWSDEKKDKRSKDMEEFLSSICDNLERCIKSGGKPLAITWKDVQELIKLEDAKTGTSMIMNYSNDLVSAISNKMKARGYTEGEHFYLTYWQSGKTRATNEFIDSTDVFLFEGLYLPNYVIEDINLSLNSTSITAKDVFLSEFIQAVYRTRIRKGEPVAVHYTDELFDSMVSALQYFAKDESEDIVRIHFSEFYPLYKSHFSRVNFYKDMVNIVDRAETSNGEEIVWRFKDWEDVYNSIKRENPAPSRYSACFNSILAAIPNSKIFIGDEEFHRRDNN